MAAQRIVVVFVIAIAAACTQSNHFVDSTLMKIADLQDRRQADSLQKFLLDKNPTYRAAAALAFGSVQDSVAALQLGNMLLEDPVTEARAAAAFALGQTSCVAASNALIPALQEKNPKVLREVLEALGKTIRTYDLYALKNFKPKDSLSQIGLAWAHYQLGLRGLADSLIAKKQAAFLQEDSPTQAQLAAAQFFSRTQNINVNQYSPLLMRASNKGNVFVRMAIVSALRKVDSAKAIEPLIAILKNDVDYRVRVAAARSLASYSSPRANKILLASLNAKNVNVGIAIAEALKPNNSFVGEILAQAKQTGHCRIRTNLYRLALDLQPSAALEREIQQLYHASSNDYERAGYLSALASQISSFEFIKHAVLTPSRPVINTSAAQALVALNQKATKEMYTAFGAAYRHAILSGDPGVIGIVCSALKEPSFGFKEVIKDFSFLQQVKSKLQLPKDVEALQPLEETIAYFEGREKPTSPKNPFNHAIDWELVKKTPANQKVKITTDKGDIILQLLVEEAPGSVANFISLANQKYFDGKNFHRVVPNFVIQGGCNRGDGFGSEDYSIRSEFGMRRYTEGSVGMASAGKDTEGTQWFITHSPTPHLDGRYTIFATVLQGMDVVHAMEVGDKIVHVALIQ
jgi:cyclophilin family peptidyl-prolyl cis-trans isomerase/HEAT repeat protein